MRKSKVFSVDMKANDEKRWKTPVRLTLALSAPRFSSSSPGRNGSGYFCGSARSLFDSNDFLFDSTNFLFASKNFLFDSNNPSVAKPWTLADWEARFAEIMSKCKKNALAVGQVHSFYYLCKRVPVDKAAMTQMAP